MEASGADQEEACLMAVVQRERSVERPPSLGDLPGLDSAQPGASSWEPPASLATQDADTNVPSMSDPRIVPHHGVTPTLASDVFIADTARVIGDVHMGPGSSLWYGAVLRGDVFHIRLGARVNIQDMAMVHVTHDRFPTLIEDDVTVGHKAMLHGCTVKRGALIGMGAMVMDEAVIGEEALVAAGAVVTPGTLVEPRWLMVGSPARPRRELRPEELLRLRRSAEHYAALAQGYRDEGHGALGGSS